MLRQVLNVCVVGVILTVVYGCLVSSIHPPGENPTDDQVAAGFELAGMSFGTLVCLTAFSAGLGLLSRGRTAN